MNQKVRKEVLAAYSDSNEFSSEPRNLDFEASEPVSVEDAVQIMSDALSDSGGGYNEFEPDLLNYFADKDVTLTLAREGSVCVYVNGLLDTASLKWVRNAVKADECDLSGNSVRIWWD